jgi:hypothetical protein
MHRPDNTSLPFFAYGVFKPGQLCYSRIRDLVEETTEATVLGYLKERDGIPLLILHDNHSHIKGYLIRFHSGKEDVAYDRIIDIEPDEVYRWELATIDNLLANVLVGRREERGSSDLENVDEWDGKEDPFFRQALEEIDSILEANPTFDWEFRALIRLEMAYMLLWSAIERYAGLKYHLGRKVNEKVFQIAGEQCFADSLKRNVKKKRQVFSTTDLSKYTLDPTDPSRSIRYYYQVRSNAVHRGKAATRDFDTLKSSLEELLTIFRDLLEEAFRQ